MNNLGLAELLAGFDEERLSQVLALRNIPEDSVADLFDLAETLLQPEGQRAALNRFDRITLAALSLLAENAGADAADGAEESADADKAATASGLSTGQLLHRLSAPPDNRELLERGLDVATRALLVRPAEPAERLTPAEAAAAAGGSTDDTLWQLGPALQRSVLAELTPSLQQGPFADPARVDQIETLTGVADRALHIGISTLALLEEADRQPYRELGKGGLSAADAQRAATATGLATDAVTALISLAVSAGLLRRDRIFWRATPGQFAAREPAERWSLLADSWRNALSPNTVAFLQQQAGSDWSHLAEQHKHAFPLHRAEQRQQIERDAAAADLLGITVSGRLSAPGLAVLLGDTKQALALFVDQLPHPVDQVYLQHDLSIVAMGPLRAHLDARLRQIAATEGHGLASRYRITESSLLRAAESGIRPSEVRAFLSGLSLSGIPQPLDFLLNELEHWLGSLRLVAVWDLDDELPGARSVLISDDPELAERLLIDSALSVLALREAGAGRMSSPVSPAATYSILREARYPVIYADTRQGAPGGSADSSPDADSTENASGGDNSDRGPRTRRRAGMVSPHPDDAQPSVTESETTITARRLLAKGLAGGARQAWLGRELQRAIRSREAVRVTVALPDGSETSQLLVPASVAGGRLRARDALLDVERTLPLSSIVRLDPQ